MPLNSSIGSTLYPIYRRASNRSYSRLFPIGSLSTFNTKGCGFDPYRLRYFYTIEELKIE